MAAAADIGSYKEVMLFLGTAGVVVPLAARLRISPVLGFIGAGALLGPYGLGRLAADHPWLSAFTITNRSEVAHLAELGVVFLLFTIGLELTWERLRILRRLVFGLGAAQVALSSAVLAAAGLAIGLSRTEAVLSALALALSSTAIVVPILAGQKRLNSATGRTSFSILLFQDLAVAPVLFMIAASSDSGGGVLAGLFVSLVQAAIALLVIVVAGRLLMRPLFGLVAQTGSPELFMAASFLMVITAALLAASSGLSMALGAFVAGLLLAETEYRRAIEATVEPFKGLLLGVFFVSVGMALDVGALARDPLVILAVASGVVVIKAAVILGLARAFGLPKRIGLETGLLLGPGGEFAFVLIGAAVAAKLVAYDTGQAIFVVTTATMVMIPILARLARGASRRIAAASPAVALPDPIAEPDRVLVAGYGRVGQLVGDMLGRHGVPFLAMDSNPALVVAQRGGGQPVYYGDSSVAAFLRACGIEQARALVVTLDSPAASQALVEVARQIRPDLTIVARARDARHARELYRLGVTDAVPETVEASLQLSEAVLVDIGIAMGPIIASIHERRDEFRRSFRGASEAEGGSDRPPSGEFRARRTVGKR